MWWKVKTGYHKTVQRLYTVLYQLSLLLLTTGRASVTPAIPDSLAHWPSQ